MSNKMLGKLIIFYKALVSNRTIKYLQNKILNNKNILN